MITRIKIPQVDENEAEVTLTAWMKKEGDFVEKGDPLAELTTAKACIEIESPCRGMVRRIVAREKSVLPVGYTIALVGGEADALPDVEGSNLRLMAQHRGRSGAPAAAGSPAGANEAPNGTLRATPAARRLARELGVDLRQVAARARGATITESMLRELGGTGERRK